MINLDWNEREYLKLDCRLLIFLSETKKIAKYLPTKVLFSTMQRSSHSRKKTISTPPPCQATSAPPRRYHTAVILQFVLVLLGFVAYVASSDGLIYQYEHEISMVTQSRLLRAMAKQESDSTSTKQQNKSHMLSLEPLKHSLHPKWKLWDEMSPDQQDDAIKEIGTYLTKYGSLISPAGKKRKKIKHGQCQFEQFKNGHALCGPRPSETDDCTFFSFGINDDPSFDVQLAEDWHCRGFAGDPTVPHPSKLHPRVTFHNVGASMLSDNEERKINKGGDEDWWTTSMPKLRYWLGVDHIHIVKLDCEGCEFALARDILREDPYFLHHIDQISIETHVSRTWLNTREELYYFGLHFALLEEAGFQLEWSDVFGCSKRHEVTGCLPDLVAFGFPCGYEPWPGKTKVVLGESCHDFLWKRYPLQEQTE